MSKKLFVMILAFSMLVPVCFASISALATGQLVRTGASPAEAATLTKPLLTMAPTSTPYPTLTIAPPVWDALGHFNYQMLQAISDVYDIYGMTGVMPSKFTVNAFFGMGYTLDPLTATYPISACFYYAALAVAQNGFIGDIAGGAGVGDKGVTYGPPMFIPTAPASESSPDGVSAAQIDLAYIINSARRNLQFIADNNDTIADYISYPDEENASELPDFGAAFGGDLGYERALIVYCRLINHYVRTCTDKSLTDGSFPETVSLAMEPIGITPTLTPTPTPTPTLYPTPTPTLGPYWDAVGHFNDQMLQAISDVYDIYGITGVMPSKFTAGAFFGMGVRAMTATYPISACFYYAALAVTQNGFIGDIAGGSGVGDKGVTYGPPMFIPTAPASKPSPDGVSAAQIDLAHIINSAQRNLQFIADNNDTIADYISYPNEENASELPDFGAAFGGDLGYERALIVYCRLINHYVRTCTDESLTDGSFPETVSLSMEPVPIRSMGDVNNDGKVNTLDIAIIQGCILKIKFLYPPTGANFIAADMNGDGIINTQDIGGVQNIILNH